MKQIDEILKVLLEIVQNTQNFILTETPEYIQQALNFVIWEAKFEIFCAVGTFVFGLAFLLMAKIIKEIKKECCCNDGIQLVPLIIGVIFTFVGSLYILVSIFCYFHTINKIKIAPKVFIVDYLTDKLNK